MPSHPQLQPHTSVLVPVLLSRAKTTFSVPNTRREEATPARDSARHDSEACPTMGSNTCAPQQATRWRGELQEAPACCTTT